MVRLTFLFFKKRQDGVYPLRKLASHEPVIVINIDNTKIRKIFYRHNKFPLKYGEI